MEFQHYWLTLKRHWLPITAVFGTVTAITILTLLAQEPIYETEGKLRFTKQNTTPSLTGLLEESLGDFDPMVEDDNPINTEIEVMRSAPTIQETIDRLQLKDSEGNPLKRQQFLEQLRVVSTRGTNILRIAYQDSDPELATRVVNTLMQIYLEQHLLDNRADTTAARKFIERQLPTAERNVRQIDADLRRFKERNNIADLEEEATALVEASEDLRHSIAEVQAEFANVATQSTGFSQELGMSTQAAIAATALSQSSGVQQVLTTLQEVESQLASERVRFQDRHPVIRALETRKANLNVLLDQRIQQTLNGQPTNSSQNLQIGELRAELIGDLIRTEVARRGLSSKISTLTDVEAAYRSRISLIPQLEQQQRELGRQLEAAQITYSTLLERLHEIRIAENQNIGHARVIQQATLLEEPIAPREGRHLVAGLFVGVLLSAATALTLEAVNKSMRTIQETRKVLSFPLLGLIPLVGQSHLALVGSQRRLQADSALVVRDIPTSPVSEAYRLLQTNLISLRSKRKLKIIAVASSVPNEGKSFVCSNLAMSIAQFGNKVLLIDADMRCPSQHKIWNVRNDVGLSYLLTEQHDLDIAVKIVSDNVSVLTAGAPPPNPAVLLNSQQMSLLLEEVSSYYDWVIIDTPALNVAADLLVLGHKTDGILFVACPEVVDIINAYSAREHLEQSGQDVLGLIINGAALEREPRGSYYGNQEALVDLNISHSRQADIPGSFRRREVA
jgi:polysaccharide biosynthesis transport protein